MKSFTAKVINDIDLGPSIAVYIDDTPDSIKVDVLTLQTACDLLNFLQAKVKKLEKKESNESKT